MPAPPLVLALVLVVPFAASAARFARAIWGTGERWRRSPILFGGLLAGALLLFFLGAIPMIGLYLGIWIASLLSFGALGGYSKRSLVIANAIALCLVLACSLVFFGYLSALEATGVNTNILADAAGTRGVVRLLTGASLVLACLFALALSRVLDDAYPATESADHALKPFQAFVFFAIVYELLDLAPFSFGTWFSLMPYFLFGGSAILTLFCAVFSVFTAYLGAEAFRESESIALERRKRDEELRMRLFRQQATADPLTGLAVRRVGRGRLDELESDGTPYIVAFIDVNNLKELNDAYGHATGDDCLRAFSRALADAFPDADAVRWGGDEFLIVMEHAAPGELEARLDNLHAETATPDGNVAVRFCYGTASSELGDAEAVLKHADDVMYDRKRDVHRAANERVRREGGA